MIQFNADLIEEKEKVEVIRYPAGEIQVRLRPKTIEAIQKETDVLVTWRFYTTIHMMEVALLLDAIRSVFTGNIYLYVPYLPFGRADRRFTTGDCFGLEVFASILNVFKCHNIITLDNHSIVSENLVPKIIDLGADLFIHETMKQINNPSLRLLYPDAGALNRYHTTFQTKELIVCAKKRNPTTGVFEGFTVPNIEGTDPILIVDDICDGGGTFNGIAAKIPDGIDLYLYVTHGIFSKGLDALSPRFKKIFTTDSRLGIYRGVDRTFQRLVRFPTEWLAEDHIRIWQRRLKNNDTNIYGS